MANSFKMMIGGGAALAATLALAAPAGAQYYPQPYPQQTYPQPYPQQQGGILGAIVNSVTGGYGQYPQGNYGYERSNQRSAISQCAAAAEQRIGGQYRQNGYGQNGYGYQNGYAQGGGRVLGITNVEQRGNGSLRVTGVATSGRGYAYGNQGYGQGYGNQPYGNAYGQGAYGAQAQADLRFTCRVNLRGQVSEVKISRNNGAYRGY